jgi:integrase
VKAMKENILPLTVEEIQLLFEEMKGNIIYDISLCSFLTGMRLGEIIGLKEPYIDFKK